MRKLSFYPLILLMPGLFFITGCDDEESEVGVPTVETTTTEGSSEITYTTVEISGNVTANGGNTIDARGVCWSESPTPTINDSKTEEATNTFTSLIENLSPNTSYYFRVYATNQSGTGYSNQLQLSTSTLDSTMWDFLIEYDANTSWHADVNFYPDGTTMYDEPSNPGQYTTYGTWTLNGDTLHYDMDASDTTNAYYQFTGTFSGNTMSGTFTYGDEPDKTWSAVKY
ncbi:MAG TPA: hypothetical protein VJ937_09425 [Salinivirga sp.]|uniref:hypothetical protein n=1 Tax=Salinivirga sp. TaxID=1970192 RepID=UPI002B47D5B4|nr:hypothetical protein [Salinivirga sp.]HKK59687.1 hypothetical protein [Salinivirga sp.]